MRCTSFSLAYFGRSCGCLSCFPGLRLGCASFGRSYGGRCCPGVCTFRFGEEGVFFFPFTNVHSPSGSFSDAVAVITAATVADTTVVDAIVVDAVFVVVIVGQGGGCKFLPRHDLDMCPDTPQVQQYGLCSSTITSIRLSPHSKTFGISLKPCLVSVTCKTMSPVAIPVF